MGSFAVVVDTIANLLASLAIAVPVIGAIVLRLRTRWGHVSWRQVLKAIQNLHRKMSDAGYRPKCIVCIGRSGAIVGALLSERFGSPLIPIVVLSYDYAKDVRSSKPEDRFILRPQQLVDFSTIKRNIDNVLLLGVDVVTGATMRSALEDLKKRGVLLSGTACLFWNPDATLQPQYYSSIRRVRPKYSWNSRGFRERYGLQT